MALVKITYYRNNNVDNLKSAIVKETQVNDIKHHLSHIRIIKIENAPANAKRDYILY